jgi:hypothetical protein
MSAVQPSVAHLSRCVSPGLEAVPPKLSIPSRDDALDTALAAFLEVGLVCGSKVAAVSAELLNGNNRAVYRKCR